MFRCIHHIKIFCRISKKADSKQWKTWYFRYKIVPNGNAVLCYTGSVSGVFPSEFWHIFTDPDPSPCVMFQLVFVSCSFRVQLIYKLLKLHCGSCKKYHAHLRIKYHFLVLNAGFLANQELVFPVRYQLDCILFI